MALRFRGLDAPIEVVYRKSGGSTPQPVDPYQQAAAQYGLSTGTAEFNAGLNRTNSVNPLGSSTWSTTGGTTGAPYVGIPNQVPQTPQPTQATPAGGTLHTPASSAHSGYSPNPLSADGLTGTVPYGLGGAGVPTGGAGYNTVGGPNPPTYTQTTQLQPWAQSELEQPIDTSGIAGMPGGPSTTQDLLNTQRSLYNQQEAYLQPQQQLANEQLQSQLANEGITPGSAAYNNAMDTQNRANTFAQNQAINSAIQGGGAEQSRLFGLGTQSLENQITARNAPINEFNSLQGGAGANATAQTPDIGGAFNQQFQGQLAGYNANTATNNANNQALEEAAAMAAIYFF